MKKLVIISSIVIAFVYVMTFFSIYQAKKLEGKSEKTAVVQEEKVRIKQEPSVLVPANPEDYGMVVIDENNKPRTQEDWDRLIIGRIRDAKFELTAQQTEELRAKIQEDPQKTQEKLKKIDEAIAKCYEILRGDPLNQDARDKLDRLMMLKSISKEFPK